MSAAGPEETTLINRRIQMQAYAPAAAATCSCGRAPAPLAPQPQAPLPSRLSRRRLSGADRTRRVAPLGHPAPPAPQQPPAPPPCPTPPAPRVSRGSFSLSPSLSFPPSRSPCFSLSLPPPPPSPSYPPLLARAPQSIETAGLTAQARPLAPPPPSPRGPCWDAARWEREEGRARARVRGGEPSGGGRGGEARGRAGPGARVLRGASSAAAGA